MGAAAPEPAVARRRSIPARIFAGYALVVLAFAAVAAVSVLQHQRTARTLDLLNDGYLRLSLSISEARAIQGAFATMVDRPAEEDSAAADEWLRMARQIRPGNLQRALYAASEAEKLATEPRDIEVLRKIRAELEAVQLEYELAEEDFDVLSDSGPVRDRAAAVAARQGLRAREQNVQQHLRRAWSAVRERIAATTTAAEEDEARAVGLVVGLSMVVLALGLAVAWWSQRLLAPLPRLQERVAAVARGELDARLEHHADDEIGVVGAEFERMVDALGQRDERLRRAERLAAIGKLAAHVTHEVRNPLNSIRLNMEMLEEDLEDAAPDARSLLSAIAREVERLTSITEQYLRLARLPDPSLEPGMPGELARELANFVKPEMERAGVDVVLQLEPTPAVAMDEGQLRQALLNLLRNARESMPEGGRVELSVTPEDGGVKLRLRDHGTGIPTDERENIFDLFYTTKQHGTGLGLPLTQQIIVAHGGTILCEAADGGGTAFEVWLPGTRETPGRDDDDLPAPSTSEASTLAEPST